jgi:hypothetical protein
MLGVFLKELTHQLYKYLSCERSAVIFLAAQRVPFDQHSRSSPWAWSPWAGGRGQRWDREYGSRGTEVEAGGRIAGMVAVGRRVERPEVGSRV